MHSLNNNTKGVRPAHRLSWPWPALCSAMALSAALAMPAGVCAQAQFATPEQAADALIDALATTDREALGRVLGQAGLKLVPPDTLRPEDRYAFLEKAAQKRTVNVDGKRAALMVGNDPWTFPLPLQQVADGRWRFDPVAGREALLDLTIGANERAAMQAILAYVDAQREYALTDRNGDGVLEYAQKLGSSPGRRDGLIWSQSLGDESPLGEAFVPARPGEGYYGYRYRILTAQGPNARGGARSYLIGGRMTRGFALVAWPVRYGESGVMSFIVNQDGRVYERDLGPQSASVAAAIRRFDPDDTWKPSQP